MQYFSEKIQTASKLAELERHFFFRGEYKCPTATIPHRRQVLHQHANRKMIEDPIVGSEQTFSTPNLQWC